MITGILASQEAFCNAKSCLRNLGKIFLYSFLGSFWDKSIFSNIAKESLPRLQFIDYLADLEQE
jgi:hypothetical protein